MDQKIIISIFLILLAIVVLLSVVSVADSDEMTEPVETESRPEVIYTVTFNRFEMAEPVESITSEPVDEPVNEPESLGVFKVTAYCACAKCCGKWADGITKTGTIATEGRTIAVDPKVIPLGSVVEFNGNEYVAEDIGGAIKGNRIDLFFESHQDALDWGVQNHEVFSIKEVS